MSFCLEDGSPLIIDSEAQTAEKIDDVNIPDPRTSPNQSRKTSQQAGSQNPGSNLISGPRRSYLGIIVGIFALGSFLLITLGLAGGIWWYLQTTAVPGKTDRTTITQDDPKPPEPPAKPVKKGGALTIENYKKIKNGMTYEEVVEIFGEEGEEISSLDVAGYKSETYIWKSGTFTTVTLTFQNEKLMSKFQIGLD
ncbi:MAG: DUF3862 domain-containing protein [Acidobacteria bacterium]|nr:DUF3862 domain-containing protein [Acidobacteriota bacterium]